ncbi:hypothetical protein [Streptomyces sp. NPDC056296]
MLADTLPTRSGDLLSFILKPADTLQPADDLGDVQRAVEDDRPR